MRILLLSVNHQTAPVSLREKLALPASRLESLIADFRSQFPTAEFVCLSTCNRTELYVGRLSHVEPSTESLVRFLADACGIDENLLTPACKLAEHEPAVEHLFRVTAGLESMVLGESQILGQVKRAYEAACGAGSVGPVLHRVFQGALGVGKQARACTGISNGRVSVASVAVGFARQIFDRFEDKTVVSIGAGEMVKLMLRHLADLKPAKLWLANRSQENAAALAQMIDLEAIRGGPRGLHELPLLLEQADIVLTSAGAAEPLITASSCRKLMRRRHRRPLFLIDIAVPRNVEPAVGNLENVFLYNIDHLASVVSRSRQERAGEIEQCEKLIAAAVHDVYLQIQNREAGQVIRALRQRLTDVGEAEMARTLRKAGAADGDELTQLLPQLLQEHTHRLINKILHLPVTQMNQAEPAAPLSFYSAALKRLFELEQLIDESWNSPDGTGPAADRGEAAAREMPRPASVPDIMPGLHEPTGLIPGAFGADRASQSRR